MAISVQSQPGALAPTVVESKAASVPLPNPIHPQFLPLLDQDFVDYYNRHFASKPATHTIDISDIRKSGSKYSSPWERDFSGEPFVRDFQIPSSDGHLFRVRCYYPDATKYGPGPYPIYVNFHGGGFAFGGLKSDAELCMLVRNNVGLLVVDVEYRLTPENLFGKGHEDGWAAVRWVHEHGHEINGDPTSISVGGISAGGAIGAVVQQLARDAGITLKLAFLAVPTVESHRHLTDPSQSPYKSFSTNALAPSLNWARLDYFRKLSLPQTKEGEQALAALPEFYSSPIKGNLKGLCHTFVATAEFDPLCDEGEAYAQRLVEAGVKVTVRRYTGVPHPFMHMTPIQKAALYAEDFCSALRAAHR
ncbi:hypothetical protein ABEF91_004295 [Exophiala dermatitidis]